MAIDLICGLVAAYTAWQGYNRGIITTIFNLLAYFFGVVVALKVTPFTTQLLEQVFKTDNPLMFIAGFVANILVVVFLLRQAAKGVESVLEAAHLGTVNKLLGAMVSGALGVVIFSVIVWFGVKSNVLTDALMADSRTYNPILKPLPTRAKEIAYRLKPLAEEGWNTFSVWLDRVDNYQGRGKEPKEPIQEGRRIYDIQDNGIERDSHE